MAATVADVIRILDTLAPPGLAEHWDHVGLQVGAPQWPVQRIWTALDATENVVDAAADAGVDLLIVHHPLLMTPVDRIRTDTPMGRIIQRAITRPMAIVAAHTNLDAANGGLNDWVAKRLGLVDCRPLVPAEPTAQVKLVFFVPQTAQTAVIDAIRASPAGRIGTYVHCTFSVAGTGAFEPTAESRPAVGAPDGRIEVSEVRIETPAVAADAAAIIERVRAVHPYETMAYDVYPIEGSTVTAGIGRVGRLPDPLPLNGFTAAIIEQLELITARRVGDVNRPIERVALCTGSGGSLMPAFLASGADVYVSGDFGYHHARDAEAAGRALIDIGHFGSEHVVGQLLAEHLTDRFQRDGIAAVVTACPMETDPFVTVGNIPSR